MTITAKSILDATAVVLERDGWTQGDFTNSSGQHCVRGAMMQAFYELRQEHAATHEAEADYRAAVAAQRESRRAKSILEDVVSAGAIEWNDHPHRTATQVLDAVRKAARLAAS